MQNYDEWTEFIDIYLEDSYLLGLLESPDRIRMYTDLVLLPGHAQYKKPGPDEAHCFREGQIIFDKVRRYEWREHRMEVTQSPSAEEKSDYGSIDCLYKENDTFVVAGAWGELQIECENVSVILDKIRF